MSCNIEDIEGMNGGTVGDPPPAVYPQ